MLGAFFITAVLLPGLYCCNGLYGTGNVKAAWFLNRENASRGYRIGRRS